MGFRTEGWVRGNISGCKLLRYLLTQVAVTSNPSQLKFPEEYLSEEDTGFNLIHSPRINAPPVCLNILLVVFANLSAQSKAQIPIRFRAHFVGLTWGFCFGRGELSLRRRSAQATAYSPGLECSRKKRVWLRNYLDTQNYVESLPSAFFSMGFRLLSCLL